MSHIMEKTLASIPKLLTQSLIGGSGASGGGGTKMSERQAPPVEVQNFMKNVHRARSKSHEAHIVNSELSNIKQKLKQIDLVTKSSIVRTSFTKVLFCHLLGYDVHFIGIETIKFANQGRGFDKRLGYLMSCLILGPHSDITLLMMSTILKDINSSNMMDNCIALKVAGELVVKDDTISLFLPDVVSKFKHQHDLVKEKALHCFSNFYNHCPDLLHSDLEKLNVFLTSRDPGILMAVMNIFVTLTSENPSRFIGLGSSFHHILDQINNRGFGSNYYYHMTPLPWLQISLLKVLANIGHVDSHLSDQICPLLKNLIEKTKVSVPISLAVLVECILTATKIHPNEALLQLCSRCISKLLSSDSNEDMRYQGLGLLIALSRIKQSFVSQHQMAIVECLTNEDHTIQSRTTLLLHAMANRANVKAICSKLFEQLESTTKQNFQQEILMMISDLAERFSPNIDWYICTNLSILSHELPQTKQDKVVDLVLKKLGVISKPDQVMDKAGACNLAVTLFTVLEKRNYLLAEFSLAIQLLGSLAPILQENFSPARFLDSVSDCLCNCNDENVIMRNTNKSTFVYSPDFFSDKNNCDFNSDKARIKLKLQCVMTVTKMLLCDSIEPSSVIQWLDSLDYKTKIKNSFIQSDLQELEDLARNPNDLQTKSLIFSQDNPEIDFSLSFLDSLVVEDLSRGNDCYRPPYIRRMNALQQQLLHDSSSFSLAVVGEDESRVNNSDMTESQTSQSKRKVISKWRDDDIAVGDDWNITSVNDSAENFILVDPDGRQLEENDKKKKATEELFAGLDESGFDTNTSTELTTVKKDLLSSEVKRPKTIWDDDDDDVDDHSKHHGIFNVGHIEINPFGISKKLKTKPMKWTQDLENEQSFSNMTDAGVPVKPLRSLSHPINNNDDEFHDSMYTSSLELPNSLLSNEPWSDHKESLSSVPETFSPTIYSDSPLIETAPHSLAGSAVDALTDSDPETTSC